MELDRSTLLDMFTKMVRIRKFEDRVHDRFAAGKLPGFVHLYAGEEAVAVGVCASLTDRDYITSTHRGHGHCIAKGCDLKGMMAELYGKATGLCKGKGGSMHIADVSRGMLGANGIVGAGMPLAAGAGLAARILGNGAVAVAFFGDGANNQGTFHESLNLAAIWRLPVVFVAENNGYAESTPVKYATAADHIADRAPGYGIPGVVVDGQDLFAVYEAARAAVQRARDGQGPTLLECETYRYYGHFEGDAQKYKTPAEVEHFRRQRDPLILFRQRVLQRGLLAESDLDAVEARVQQEVDEAVALAEASPLPAAEELLTDVYVRL